MTTIPELEAEVARLRERYATEMDHLAKYARVESEQTRAGSAPDALAGAVLQRALSTYHLWVEADKNLWRVRQGR